MMGIMIPVGKKWERPKKSYPGCQAPPIRPFYLAQLAGPITDMREYNRRAFAEVAEEMVALGYRVWNPNDWSDLRDDIDPESLSKEFWMRRSICKLFEADLLVVLPGWVISEGTKAERAVAQQIGIPIIYWSEHPRAYHCEWLR